VPDRPEIAAGGEDVSILEVRVVDERSRIVPTADNRVTFAVSGAGRLIGVGSGNPSSHEADKGQTRRAFNGLAMAIVQSSGPAGEITVDATSPGLKPARLVLRALPAAPRPRVT
jgi:beta-galactosidase